MHRSPLPGLALALIIAGCTGPSGYPSLQPRPIESMSLAEPTVPPARPASITPEAAARYQPSVEQARSADAHFRAVLDEERGTLARGRAAATGSDAWTEAQQSLSRVETARAPVEAALSDLDAARDTDRTRADSGELAAVMQAFDAVSAIDSAERGALEEAAGALLGT